MTSLLRACFGAGSPVADGLRCDDPLPLIMLLSIGPGEPCKIREQPIYRYSVASVIERPLAFFGTRLR